MMDEKLKKLCPSPKLKGLDFDDEEIEKVRRSHKLLMITIFTTRLCNLHCPYCYTNAGTPLPNELTVEEYKRIIIEAKELGAKTVWIPGAGEPLLQKTS